MSTMDSDAPRDTCPHCGSDLSYVSPEGGTFSRRIGVELQGIYDGVLFWVCPVCQHAWHTWIDPYMAILARLHMAAWLRGAVPGDPDGAGIEEATRVEGERS